MMNLINKIQTFFFPTSISESLDTVNFSDKFISLSVNKVLTGTINMNRIIQIEDSKNNISQYVLFNESNVTKLECFKNNRLVSFSQEEDFSLSQKYIDIIADLFHFSISKSKEILNKGSEVTSDINGETKGLEWLRVSLVVLKSAIIKSIDDPTLSFDGQFFSGQRPGTDHYQMRIHCLSLDFLLEFLGDGRLRVSAWNYKNQEPNSKAEPLFINEFVKLKQSVFDEFIQLLVLMSKASTKIS